MDLRGSSKFFKMREKNYSLGYVFFFLQDFQRQKTMKSIFQRLWKQFMETLEWSSNCKRISVVPWVEECGQTKTTKERLYRASYNLKKSYRKEAKNDLRFFSPILLQSFNCLQLYIKVLLYLHWQTDKDNTGWCDMLRHHWEVNVLDP